MSSATEAHLGRVRSLWRYPVKSMVGEELLHAQVLDNGLVGDRAFALLDRADGKVATAKNPRKWPRLFAFRATFDSSGPGAKGQLRMMLPDGTTLTSEQKNVDQALSKALNRDVTLASTERGRMPAAEASMSASWSANAEEYWPDIEGLDYRDTVTEFPLPAGTFFDCATVHLLTTATLDRLRNLYPRGRFEVQRFRPNIVVENMAGDVDFPENSWLGHTLAIGEEVRLDITAPCGRCVMTTLAQGDLPNDSGILRTAVQHNRAHVGVYAAVIQGGTIRSGDRVRLVS